MRQVSENGVVILCVADKSPAAQANLRSTKMNESGDFVWGDVVVSINGQPIKDSEALLERLQEFHAGDEVLVGIKREGEYSRVPIRLTSRSAATHQGCSLFPN